MPRKFTSAVSADVTLVTTTETVAATLSGLATKFSNEKISIAGWAQVEGGTATTFATLRVRRGSLTGALVGDARSITLTGAAIGNLDINVDDTPGEIANQTYVLTVQLTGATANGVIAQSYLAADIGK